MEGKKLRLRQCVGVISKDGYVEFFSSNTRSSLTLKMDFINATDVLAKFNGLNYISDILEIYPNLSKSGFINLVKLLYAKHILIEQDTLYPQSILDKHYRLINTLEDYKYSSSAVLNTIDILKRSKVMLIGLGAVGSLIAAFLAKNGVEQFVLVDNDTVDISNLHRQYYFESNVTESKLKSLSDELACINSNIECELVDDCLDKNFFLRNNFSEIDLIINCSDYPSVDFTSEIVAKYAMQNNIAHIIGGGYNLHLTLIGQTIIPFKTPCFKCFSSVLSEINNKDLENIKKLYRENRKLGAFPPLSGIAASLAALDAFKLLIGETEYLQQKGKRIEFNIQNHQFNTIEIPKNPNCERCGDERKIFG